ncbi:hypothetical protein [Algoriphagus sp.]
MASSSHNDDFYLTSYRVVSEEFFVPDEWGLTGLHEEWFVKKQTTAG